MPYRESAVLAADGRPILIATEPAYRGGGAGRRFTAFPSSFRVGPNAALLPGLDQLRARSRALYRNSGLVWGAIEKLVANYVGWGAMPKSQHPSAAARTQIDEAWRLWSKQIKLDQIQKLVTREFAIAGEIFVRMRPRLRTDTDDLGRRLHVPLVFQLLEAEHCPVFEDRPLENGRFVRAGIEFDAIGNRAAYWLYPRHPGDGTFSTPADLELRAVPASEVVHIYDPESPASIRGVPRLSRSLLRASDLEAFTDATLQRQAIASLFAGFIRRPEGGAPPGMLGETNALPEPTFEPGTLTYLGEGEDISFPTTPDPGQNYYPFVKTAQRDIAAGIGVTHEQISNDLEGVNYSSIRAGSLEFRRGAQVWQYTTFLLGLLEPIWWRFLQAAALAGVIDVPDLLTDPLRASAVEWIFQGWDWVDPEKEVNASTKSVQAGFDTRRSVNMARGNDPTLLVQERAAEVEEAKQLGLTFSTDVTTIVPASPANPPAASTPAKQDSAA